MARGTTSAVARTPARRRGAALVLVLILLATGAMTSLSYLASASIAVSASVGYADAARARHIAESGVHHGMCLLRENPEMLRPSDQAPLGPFPVDGGDDSYTLSVAETGVPGQFEIVCTASSGRANRTVAAVVQHTGARKHTAEHAVLANSPLYWHPFSMEVVGDLHVNGSAVIFGGVDGDVTATQSVFQLGWVSGAVQGGRPAVAVPQFNAADYQRYLYDETPGEAAEVTDALIAQGHAIDGGGLVTVANPAGVAVAAPGGGSLWIWENVSITGTLVVEGDLVIDGWNVTLEALDGFPAVVATGRVFITDNARNVEIRGLVYAAGGVFPYGSTSSSDVEINGGLICGANGVSVSLSGSHRVRYSPSRAAILDPTGWGAGGKVEILQWRE